MMNDKTLQLYGQSIVLPATTQAYGSIRRIATFRTKAVLKKLEEMAQQSLHLVAAFEKLCAERPLLVQHEIDYYLSQGKLLHNDLDEEDFRRDANEAIQLIAQFEAKVQQRFDEAKAAHNLKAINEHIFVPKTFENYYEIVQHALMNLHSVYMRYAAALKNEASWHPEALPFQQWADVKQCRQALKEQPSKERVIALLLADPYEPAHIALAYALYGNPNDELSLFLEQIGYPDAQTLLIGCEQARTLFGEKNAAIHLMNDQNPLFHALLQQQALVSLHTACAYAITQFSDLARSHLSQNAAQDVLFAYTMRKSTVLTLSSTSLKGKGKWFKTIQVPYSGITKKQVRDGFCTINQTVINLPHFDRQDDILMLQLLQFMTTVATAAPIASTI
jgi:hypothetical protein